MNALRRPMLPLVAFGAIGLYGVLRWATLLSPAPSGRLLGLLALSTLLVAVAPLLARRRALAGAGLLVVFLAALAISGIPLAWIRHIRLAVIADAIGQGVGALPRVLVPYNGVNEWVRFVTLLGAGVLLIGAAAALTLPKRPLNARARLLAAVPLLALAVVPMTLAHPRLPYVQGLILFALLALFVWGERLQLRSLAGACALTALAAAGGLALAPAMDPHKPWVNYQALAGAAAPGNVESFDWSQRYGPLGWPRTGREVFDVQADRPDYWKAQDLSVFDGRGWVEGASQFANPLLGVAQAAQARFTQTLHVTIRAMRSSDVIAAGAAAQPSYLPTVVLPGSSPGTWTTSGSLAPGDSYTITTYSPHPSGGELASVPPAPAGVSAIFSAGYRASVLAPAYAPVFAIARSLQNGTRTPYAYVQNVERYLAHGFVYDENPPRRRYPLVAFLTRDKRGYCQQFAGAMALLLRMGGVPARVAVGFTTGTYDRTHRQYVVSDLDAHAWVEAWFQGYGWVPFDPTPTAAPARGGQAALPVQRGGARTKARPQSPKQLPSQQASASRGRGTHHGSGSLSWPLPVALVLLAALAGAALLRARRRQPRQPDQLLFELERAMARCGRPLAPGTTLASLEHRFRSSAQAASYVRAIRLRRYGGAAAPRDPAGRRALRAQLRHGLGALGALRAFWALPPRLH